MSFLVRILFSGLIAFVPSQNGTEVNVLLLNIDHTYHTSDSASLADHFPVLIARAGSCTGTCPTSDSTIATKTFSDQSTNVAIASLEDAVAGGGAWQLAGAELTIQRGSTSDPALPALDIHDGVRGTTNSLPNLVPTTSAQREDYSWLADLQQICSSGCDLDEALIGTNPPPGIIAARLKLNTGKLYTFSVARIGTDVTPVHFERLDEQGSISPYTQAIASWMASDIEVEGSSVKIVDSAYNSGAGRSMTLSPDSNGLVEVAVLNLPPFVPPTTSSNPSPAVGTHFEAYYELLDTPPSAATRLVPKAGVAPNSPSYPSIEWDDVHPSTAVGSDLLAALRLDIGRSTYDRTLCPMIGSDPPPPCEEPNCP